MVRTCLVCPVVDMAMYGALSYSCKKIVSQCEFGYRLLLDKLL